MTWQVTGYIIKNQNRIFTFHNVTTVVNVFNMNHDTHPLSQDLLYHATLAFPKARHQHLPLIRRRF